MSDIIIHIGSPRTGTTVLQKHLYPLARKTIIYSKRAYGSSVNFTKPGKSYFELDHHGQASLLKKAANDINSVPPTLFLTRLLIEPSIMLSGSTAQHSDSNPVFEKLCRATSLLKSLSISEQKPILISSERLCDTTASLFGYSTHENFADSIMAWKTLCEAVRDGCKVTPKVTVALRSPIDYLRSKYIRNFVQRRAMKNERDLKPSEFIEKQARLESGNPGTSVLAPAFHAEFIKELQKHAFVKAFGFKTLLSTDDTFSLIGLQGEAKHEFNKFPKENRSPFSSEQEQFIESEITQSLKRLDLYKRIANTQLYE